MTATPVLEMRHIAKAFGKFYALKGVDLTVWPGEIHALMGENGAGKSTLMKILAGAYTATSGEILIDGKPQTIRGPKDALAAGITLIYQEMQLAPNLTVAENIFLGSELARGGLVQRKAMLSQAQAVIDRLGAQFKASDRVMTLTIAEQQQVEIATLRLIPNMDVWRPCDTTESAVAWANAIERKDGPTSMCFSRQNLPFQARTSAQIAAIRKGGYVLSEAEGGKPQAVILATGSEVALAMAAQKTLAEQGVAVRVVSMPSTNVFDRQDAAYRASVLPAGLPRVAVEAGTTDGWYKYVGLEGRVIGIDRFGESAPAGELFKYFGITADAVVQAVKAVL